MRSVSRFRRATLVGLLTAVGLTATDRSQTGVAAAGEHKAARPRTFCNPIDLDDLGLPMPSPSTDALEATADPSVLFFRGEYWVFTARGGIHWHTPDFSTWQQVAAKGLPAALAAPSVAVIGGRMHFVASGVPGIYATDDPAQGVWTRVADTAAYLDPALFVDDDGRVYLYYGSAENGPIRAVELAPKEGFKVVRGPVDCIVADAANRGWEIYGEDNRGAPYRGRMRLSPSIEAAAMTKHAGRYYLQYAAPTARSYTSAAGVFVGTGPLGPFTYANYSPFSHKPTGFMGGAGQGMTFSDASGGLWRASGVSVSLSEARERRLALYPAGFLEDGQLVVDTYLGDYPQYVPGTRAPALEGHSPGWMLLSHHKRAAASSAQDGFPAENAFDERVGTRWAAASSRTGEWLAVDLGKRCRVESFQVSFSGTEDPSPAGAARGQYRYYVEASKNGKSWKRLLDRQSGAHSVPHDYAQLEQGVETRHLRLVGIVTPGGGPLSVAELRVFGHGLGVPPGEVRGVAASRDATDPRRLRVSWAPSRDADFHIVRYGVAADRLYSHYQVYDTNYLEIGTLNAGVPYFVSVDAVNDSGVTRGRTVVSVK